MEALKEEMITVKFNSHVTPKVRWNNKEKKFEAIINSVDFRHEYAKLIDEEGDNPEETKKLKRMHTRLMGLPEAMNYIYGNLNDKNQAKFYYKGEVATLPKTEAEYYINQYCGGTVKLKRGKDFIEGPYKKNIDGKQGYYEANHMSRFEREHIPVRIAEAI